MKVRLGSVVPPTKRPYLGQGCKSPYPRKELLLRWLWLVVESTLFRLSPKPFHYWRALLLKLFGASIPEPRRVVVFPSARIHFPWNLALAPRSMVGPRVRLYNLAPISLGYGANLSQGAHLCAGTHDFRHWDMPLVRRPINIGENAWVAAEVFIGPGVTVGELCVVGARSVVVRDLPARSICVGNPCRRVAERKEPV